MGGFGFPCTKEGVVLLDGMHPDGIANYKKCVSGEYDVVFTGIQDFSYYYTEPAILKCSCGNKVPLDSGYENPCDKCGKSYNMSGYLLAPHSQWGEETGETYADIVSGSWDDEY